MLSVIESTVPDDHGGVYGFWFRRYCVYIGMTVRQSLRKRLSDHWVCSHNKFLRDWIKAKGENLQVSFRPLQSALEITELEKKYIRRYQPLANDVMFKKRND